MPNVEDRGEWATERVEETWRPMPIVEVGSREEDAERLRLLRANIEKAAAPSEVELIGQMSAALERIPEEGRQAAIRYLADRYGIMPRFQ